VSDWGAREVVAIAEDGASEVVVAGGPELPACIDWLPDGTLLVVAGRAGRLLRRDAGGALVPHADLTAVFAPPADAIVVDGRGNAFVNCAGFDFPGGEFAPGRVAVVTPDGAAREVADGLAFPNGMAITPDDATLIVAESYAARLTAFDVAPDGGLSGRR